MPKDRGTDLPGTVERSPAKARHTYQKAHDSAVDSYGEGERAHRTAFAALKHSFEKVGDHWEPKDHKGPSDERRRRAARQRGAAAGGRPARSTCEATRRTSSTSARASSA